MSTEQPVYVIAEAGVNHNGDVQLAHRLIDAARQAGADAVKFQTFRTERLVTRAAAMADYQRENIGRSLSQFEMLKELELSFDDFRALQEHARRAGIEFLSTPDDEESLDFLADVLQLKLLKVGSGEVNNLPFLRRIGAKGRPVVLSTGMATLGEVERAIATLTGGRKLALTLLHCTSSYPCPLGQVNLRAMQTLREAFGLPVGYSDHTVGCEVAVAATALGACVIEKHFTLDRLMPGPDHAASLDPVQLAEMIRMIRGVEMAMGSARKGPTDVELATRRIVRRRAVAARALPQGQQLVAEDLAFKRSGEGIDVEFADLLPGRRLNRPLDADAPVEWNMLDGGPVAPGERR